MAPPITLPEPTKFEASSLIFGTGLFWFSFAMVCIIAATVKDAGAVAFFAMAFAAAIWLYYGVFKIAGRAKGARSEALSSVLKFAYFRRAAAVLRLPAKGVLTVLSTLLFVDAVSFVVLLIKSL